MFYKIGRILIVGLCCALQVSVAQAANLKCQELFSLESTLQDTSSLGSSRKAFTNEFFRNSSGKTLNDVELAEVLYKKSSVFRSFFTDVTGSKKFKKALVTRELLDAYHVSFFNQFDNPAQLSEFRDRSLAESLATHGLNIKPGISSWEALAEISRANMDRFRVFDTLANIQESHPDIASVLSLLKMEFNRNSHNTEVHSDFILSSRQLERYGSQAGFNSQLDFSRKFMKTDDNVFFFVIWTVAGTRLSSQAKDAGYYGRHSWKLNQEYAKKNGWISFYVMWAKELANFAQVHLGVDRNLPTFKSVFSQMEEVGTTKSSISEWTPSTLSHATDFRNHLYTLDFNVSDFENLAKGLLANFLIQRKQKWLSVEFAKSIHRLKNDKAFLLKTLEDVLRYHGLSKMELKIPVGVPLSEIFT